MMGKTRSEAEQQEGEFVSLRSMQEKSFSRQDNKPVPRFHVRKNNGDVFTFMYHQLDSYAIYRGGEFVLLFAGAKHWQVTVKGHGPELWKCYEYISLHRMPFIVEAERDFAGDGETVFTSIEIKDVTPKMG